MRRSKISLYLNVAAIVFAMSVFALGCKKASTTTTEDTSYASDHATTEKSFSDVESVADEASTKSGSMAYRTTATTSSPCANVTRTVSGGDSVLTIDFGSSDCLCNDGTYRRGQIIVTYSGHYVDSASTHAITFNNFFENDNQITGTKTVTNMGHNSAGQLYFDVTINGSVILANSAGTISASWTRVRTWITQGTPNVYEITGSGTLTRANGTNVTVTIPAATPLVVASNCRWIESGTVDYLLPSGLTRTMNFGNAPVCDDEAQLTLPNGKTYNITMK